MASVEPLLIVGASHAGTQLAAAAREQGFDAPIVLLGDEPHIPYQRPPLSKGLLTGKTAVDQLALRGPDFYREQGIDLRLGTRVTGLDLAARRLSLADGSTLAFGWLALATGARCRALPMPGADLQGVHQLRTLDDALAVAAALGGSSQACVIGGGFIGLEVAAALRSAGAAVTVVESQPRLLARTFPASMSDYVAAAHRQRGVTLELGCGVRALHGQQGRVEAVELTDGRCIDCDLVVLGIGVQPNSELAEQAGIACDNGVLVDALGRTSAPKVLAIGDVANMALPAVPGGPQRVRLESIQAANDGARAAATLLVDRPQPLDAVPWFWSEQHELKFQMAGLPAAGDQTVLRGDMASDKYTLFYLRDGAVRAAHTVNRPAEHMLARKLIAVGARIAPELLADPSVDLKSFSTPPRPAG
ncbi:pyridine nucleotide-disulfide oxidoreductase [Hylemonella gracilis str. Niagara R]|uniref:Pyridine nucleotide-disulfide oxidoreductase n=1 Tax=Hylemonella gracilis str. Niagara R TaxID=1458275 RepID=A0A016XDR2_9BURK|nr:FAD-dependent oxidoreductase [Hylemonella gracilis]EYC49717.1 pyridine nucleotide-disulfide oxidoreductase [Hylemonella gracilis str. Niagara R]